jgi:two-component system, sensor histidine kinase
MDHPAPTTADTAGDLAARVDAELTRRLHEQDLPGIITNYCAAGLVGWLHWSTGSPAMLYGWLLAWFAGNSVYLAYFALQRRADRERVGSRGWRLSHLLISNVLSVSAAGFMPWLFSPTPELLYLNTTLVLIYFAGIYASNAMISPASYVISGGTVIAPLVALHVGIGTSGSLAIAGGSLLFYFALIPFAKVQAGALRQAIRVGYENEELARRLARQTERAEEARHEAEEANRAKARFLAAATHDLRQPLHALALTLETLPNGAAGGSGQGHVDRARECTRQLSSMFDALLDQAQLDAGTRPVIAEPVSLAVLFDQIEGQFQAQAQARGLWLRCRPTTGVVRTDALALWRIASNLVTNALAATDQGGVLVAWRAQSRTLEVRDSGRGIAAADHEAVFREFHRLPGPSSQRDRGLGLGLATVRRLAQLQGGQVMLRSAPGRGSVFGITFPPDAILAAGSVSRPGDRCAGGAGRSGLATEGLPGARRGRRPGHPRGARTTCCGRGASRSVWRAAPARRHVEARRRMGTAGSCSSTGICPTATASRCRKPSAPAVRRLPPASSSPATRHPTTCAPWWDRAWRCSTSPWRRSGCARRCSGSAPRDVKRPSGRPSYLSATGPAAPSGTALRRHEAAP